MEKQYKLVVLTNAKPGRDVEFNDWYDNVHLPDVLAVPGIAQATRYALVPGQTALDPDAANWGYLAIYDLETDEPIATVKDLNSRAGTDRMSLSEALDLGSAYSMIYEATAKPD